MRQKLFAAAVSVSGVVFACEQEQHEMRRPSRSSRAPPNLGDFHRARTPICDAVCGTHLPA
jgi:hypothetical protein